MIEPLGVGCISGYYLQVFSRRLDVIFVVGVYKAGTSLAVEICERLGFLDPSRYTNSRELGYGSALKRYLTRECSVLRRINENSLGKRDFLGLIGPIERYLLSWRLPFVLKDPRFVFTLPAWIGAARRVGFNVGVIFAERPTKELLPAWEMAPFTSDMLRLGRMQANIRGYEEQLVWCRLRKVSYTRLPLDTLKKVRRSLSAQHC